MGPATAGPGTYNYPINNVNQTFTLPSYSFVSSACSNPYEITVERLDLNTTVPFAWYPKSSTIWFKSNDPSQTGVTQYRINAA
jgi:hypothetical protein